MRCRGKLGVRRELAERAAQHTTGTRSRATGVTSLSPSHAYPVELEQQVRGKHAEIVKPYFHVPLARSHRRGSSLGRSCEQHALVEVGTSMSSPNARSIADWPKRTSMPPPPTNWMKVPAARRSFDA